MPMPTSASGGGGGAAVPARRAKADRVTRTLFLALLRPRSRFQASPATKVNPRRTNPTSSPEWLARIRRRAAGGGPAVADVVADAAGVAARRTVWPDRSRTNSGRHRFRKQPARL